MSAYIAMEKEQLFTTVPVGKAVVSLAVPTVIAQLITVVYNMADTFFIGQLGNPNQVAAATLAMPVFIFLTAFSNLFGIGGASMISRCLGAGRREKASQTASFCIWSAALLALLYGVAVILLKIRFSRCSARTQPRRASAPLIFSGQSASARRPRCSMPNLRTSSARRAIPGRPVSALRSAVF